MSRTLDSDLSTLRETWNNLYRTTLPQLAKSRDPVQPIWPVMLDHCFARIILDNTIGKSGGSNGQDTQWDHVIKKPAVQNMTVAQLQDAIALGEQIEKGKADLVELDMKSLQARGKRKRGTNEKESGNDGTVKKAKIADADGKDKDGKTEGELSSVGSPKHQKPGKGLSKQSDHKTKKQSTLSFQSSDLKQLPSPASSPDIENGIDASAKPSSDKAKKQDAYPSATTMRTTLQKIQSHPSLTPFRKRLYTALLSVPRGSHTTYAAMAKHLDSVPRAVGNGMRNNPFAPDVPCHRVLASDGTLGGFFGSWGVEGQYAKEKIGLLEGEGVKFDSGGKVRGPVWDGFWDLERFEREYGKVEA